MDLSCLTDAEILEIDKHVQKKWSKLHWALVDEDATDDEFDPVRVYVESETISVRYHKQYIKIGLGVACLRQGLADKAAFVATPVYSSSEPLAHWLPRETIRHPADEMRMARALGFADRAL